MSGETLDPRQLAGIALDFFLLNRDQLGMPEEQARQRAVDDVAETVRRVQVNEAMPDDPTTPSCRGTSRAGQRCGYSRAGSLR